MSISGPLGANVINMKGICLTLSLYVVFLCSPESLEVHGSFSWLGQTQYKLQLQAQEVYMLSLKACFFQAGVYNLGTPRVFAKLAQTSAMCETSQQSAMPALIIINSV